MNNNQNLNLESFGVAAPVAKPRTSKPKPVETQPVTPVYKAPAPDNRPVAVIMQEQVEAVQNEHNAFRETMVDPKQTQQDYFSIPKIYAEYFPNMVVGINGITMKVPADGKMYKMPKPFADKFRQKLAYMDTKISAMKEAERNARFNVVEDTSIRL